MLARMRQPPASGPADAAAGGRQPPDALDRLCALVERLRAPDGCPWDREQELGDLRAYVLEEAHEVAAAIDTGEPAELRDELGDLLFMLAFVIRVAEEAGQFDRAQVIDGVRRKIVDRHPHVFGDAELADTRAVREAWERRKLAGREDGRSLLAGVPASLPALVAAYRMTQKAAGVGFDWPDAAAVVAKVDEEIAELRQALGPGGDPEAAGRELGDLLFTLANLGRHLGIDPEAALAGANRRFRRRFAEMETAAAAAGQPLADTPPAELEALWKRAKAAADEI